MSGSKNCGTFTHNGTLPSTKKEFLPFATPWLELESIMLSEIIQVVGTNKI